MKLRLDRRYYNIYLVGAIITACFAFMIVSTIAVVKEVGGGKTSADLAVVEARKECDKKGGELVRPSSNNLLYTQCLVTPAQKKGQNIK